LLSVDLLASEKLAVRTGVLPATLVTTANASHVKSAPSLLSAARPGDTVMPREYEDHPVTNEAIEAAVALTIELRSRQQLVSLEELATEAIDSTFRICITGAAGAGTPERTQTHAALIAEVRRRVHTRIATSTTIAASNDPVDLASEQSFPASDPPAWIWR
jgi:hypothetical protein